MNNTIQYKGYVGSIEFSEEDKILVDKPPPLMLEELKP